MLLWAVASLNRMLIFVICGTIILCFIMHVTVNMSSLTFSDKTSYPTNLFALCANSVSGQEDELLENEWRGPLIWSYIAHYNYELCFPSVQVAFSSSVNVHRLALAKYWWRRRICKAFKNCFIWDGTVSDPPIRYFFSLPECHGTTKLLLSRK